MNYRKKISALGLANYYLGYGIEQPYFLIDCNMLSLSNNYGNEEYKRTVSLGYNL